MPEGPEVRLSADLIKPLVINKRVVNIFVGKTSRYKLQSPVGFDEFVKTLSNEVVSVSNISIKGKFMYWEFSNKWWMFVTYGMTGQFSPNKGKHPCLGIFLSEDHLTQPVETVYFNDPRHFGTIKFSNNPKDLTDKINELGWDPLQMPLSGNLPWLKSKLKSNKNIGEILLDQSIFCGSGNYIRAETLYKCKLSPFRSAISLNDQQVSELCQAMIEVMEESYNQNGTTISTYQNVDGSRGNYYDQLKVYGQKQDPLGNKIIKQDSGGRTIHWCPAIQV